MRINARLDHDMTEKILFIEQQTGESTSAIIRSALNLYYQQLQNSKPNALAIFEQTGFIGSGEGPTDLSENYKQYLNFADKHDYR